jgi:hypothetical protein
MNDTQRFYIQKIVKERFDISNIVVDPNTFGPICYIVDRMTGENIKYNIYLRAREYKYFHEQVIEWLCEKYSKQILRDAKIKEILKD